MRSILAVILLSLMATPVLADEDLLTPPELRREKRVPLSEQVLQPPCVIKGNIGRDGARTFFGPRDANYHSVRVDKSAGERWFCTEEDARRAGFRRAKR